MRILPLTAILMFWAASVSNADTPKPPPFLSFARPVSNATARDAVLFLRNLAPGGSFRFTITSDGGEGRVAGGGTVNGNPQVIPGIDVSALPSGKLTATVTVSEENGAASMLTASALPVFFGVLDGIPAAAAYSLRRLRSGYAGPLIRVRRDSDNREADIGGGTVGGGLSTAELSRFCGANSCYVRSWYDQSGNGRDAIQAEPANQPRITSLGMIESVNDRPAIRFDGASSTFLDLTSSPVQSLSSTLISAILRFPSQQGWARLFDFGSGPEVNMFAPLGANGRFRLTVQGAGGEQGPDPGAVDEPANKPVSLIYEHTGTAMTIRRNGESIATVNGVTLLPSSAGGNQNYIGRSQYPADPYASMRLSEFIVLSDPQPAAGALLARDQGLYFQLFKN